MLEPVSLGQGRTHCPGLAADERGVVMGRRLALFFPDVARAVGFFRSYSREVALDEILSSLQIVEAVSERGGREIMVRFEASGSYVADRAAQAARMHKGRAFTGTEVHYVPFRDRRSPLGYDVAGAEHLVADVVAEATALVLYSDAGPDRRTLGREIALRDLVLGLTPRRLSPAEAQKERHERLVVRCEQGLARALCRYLWSRQVQATVASAVSAHKSVFDHKQREIQLVTCEALPHHVAMHIASTPGMRLFVPYQEHLLVQWGFRHPIALESCGNAFDKSETILFSGPPEKVERLSRMEQGVDIRDLMEVSVHGREGVIAAPAEAHALPIESMAVELKLARLPGASGATTALLIDKDRLPWFKKLIYMLPAAILRSYEAVLADPYIIVINRRGVHGIPFGEPLFELYPQIFVPLGMQLLPRVDYELLREHLQIRPEQNLYFFPDGKPAFSIAADQMKALSRAVVAPERAAESRIALRVEAEDVPLPTPTVVHKRQGAFSLWRGTKTTRAELPAVEPALLPPRAAAGSEAGGARTPALLSAPADATPPLGTPVAEGDASAKEG